MTNKTQNHKKNKTKLKLKTNERQKNPQAFTRTRHYPAFS